MGVERGHTSVEPRKKTISFNREQIFLFFPFTFDIINFDFFCNSNITLFGCLAYMLVSAFNLYDFTLKEKLLG